MGFIGAQAIVPGSVNDGAGQLLPQQGLDPLLRTADVLDRDARAQLDHQQVLGPPETADHREINLPGADALVVAALRVHVVEVKADQPRRLWARVSGAQARHG